MVSFNDDITEITGVGSRISNHYEAKGVDTVGGLVGQSEWRIFKSSISSQYHDDARQDILTASLNGTLDQFESPAVARYQQWNFVFPTEEYEEEAMRSGHAVVGDWHRVSNLPNRSELDTEARSVVPTHRIAHLSAAENGPAYDSSGDPVSHGVTSAFYISGSNPSEPAVPPETLDGNSENQDTLIPAETVGLAATLLDADPTELLSDVRFMLDGPVCFTDPETSLPVLLGPLPRPTTTEDELGDLPPATSNIANWV